MVPREWPLWQWRLCPVIAPKRIKSDFCRRQSSWASFNTQTLCSWMAWSQREVWYDSMPLAIRVSSADLRVYTFSVSNSLHDTVHNIKQEKDRSLQHTCVMCVLPFTCSSWWLWSTWLEETWKNVWRSYVQSKATKNNKLILMERSIRLETEASTSEYTRVLP